MVQYHTVTIRSSFLWGVTHSLTLTHILLAAWISAAKEVKKKIPAKQTVGSN